jgi:SAM-dependent methyltransferase
VVPDHWFEPMADHLGSAYLRYSFTRGTGQEVAFLIDELGLLPGMRVLDVGCGPGRHAYELATRGMVVLGVDISDRFIELAAANAPDGAMFERIDARHMSFEAEFDAAISLCQGAFGLAGTVGASVPMTDPDGEILEGMVRALKPGGHFAVSAFSSYFQVRHLEGSDEFEADSGVNHEVASLMNEDGNQLEHDLWTSCFTPRELRLIATIAGARVDAVYSVTPGKYARRPPSIDEPEFLLVGSRMAL